MKNQQCRIQYQYALSTVASMGFDFVTQDLCLRQSEIATVNRFLEIYIGCMMAGDSHLHTYYKIEQLVAPKRTVGK